MCSRDGPCCVTLAPSVNSSDTLHPCALPPDLPGTGDVLGDMEQQLCANTLRIGVLEQENATLSASLAKLREKGQRGDYKVAVSLHLYSLHSPLCLLKVIVHIGTGSRKRFFGLNCAQK